MVSGQNASLSCLSSTNHLDPSDLTVCVPRTRTKQREPAYSLNPPSVLELAP